MANLMSLGPGAGFAMGTRPEIPGYVLEELLGLGASGAVWAAVDRRSGTRVAIKVVEQQSDSRRSGGWADDETASELAVLRGVRHPHVVGLVEDILLADGRVALVLELVAGGSLARVVGARGHLTAGETVTVLTTLATTLADLHRLGVVHADLSPANVLFQLGGRPMLSDLGASRVAGGGRADSAGTDGFVDPAVLAGAVPGPASDVYGLGALGWYCLTGTGPGPAMLRPPAREVARSAPDALLAALESMLDPDPAHRPSAAEVACEVYAAGCATPLRLAGGSDPASQLTRRIRAQAAAPAAVAAGGQPTAAGATSRWLDRVAWAARVGLPVASVGALILAQSSPTGLRAPAPTAGSVSVGVQPTTMAEAVTALTAARGAAFSARPVRGPDAFDASGSSAWTADAGSLAQLGRAGLHYEGLRLTVSDVAVLSSAVDRATVRVTVHPSAYDVVRTSGEVLMHQMATPATVVTLQLVRQRAVWRVAATLRSDATG